MAITKVTNSLVSVNAIHGTLIADNAITSVHIAQNQVTSVQIPDSSITAYQLAGSSVGTGQLVNLGVTEAKIANNAVTSNKIATNSVVTETIAQNSITAVQIPDGSITDTQLGSGAFTMGNITTTGSIRGPASFTIDPATVGDNTGTVVIAGNLQVDGTTTTVNSTTLDVVDKNITLGKGGSASANNGGGITIDGAAATLLYQHSDTSWQMNKPLGVTGNLSLSGDIFGTGNFDIRSTGNIYNTYGNSSSVFFRTQDGATRMTLDSSGDVTIASGIFTTIHDITTVNKFKTTNNNTRAAISMESKDSSGNAVDLRMHALGDGPRGEIFTYTNHPLAFATNNAAPQMTLLTNGNFGIGTDTPSELLTLKQTSGSGPELKFENGTSNHYIRAYDNNWNFLANASNVALTIKNSGNVEFSQDVGIGADPTVPLHIDKSGGGDLLKLGGGNITEYVVFVDSNEVRQQVDPDNDEANSLFTWFIDGSRKAIFESHGLHLGGLTAKADLDIKQKGNSWENGILLQHDNANTGWNIHAERQGSSLWFGYNADTSVALASQTASEILMITGSGNVGIKDSDPPSTLTVVGTNTADVASNGAGVNGLQITRTTSSGENIYAYMTDGNAASSSWAGLGNVGKIESFGNNAFEIGTQQDAPVVIGQDNTQKLRIKGDITAHAKFGSTYIESLYTPNGGVQNCRIFEDHLGKWVAVGYFAADAKSSIQTTWGSVRGGPTGIGQSETTQFSADWGDSYPTEVRYMGATDFNNFQETKTIDFIHGVPRGRPWKQFFNNAHRIPDGGTNVSVSLMGKVQGSVGSLKNGWECRGAYDGRGRWHNPSYTHHRMSDDTSINCADTAFTTPTSSHFNWESASDAKISVHHSLDYSGQDGITSAGFGNDDNIVAFFDDYPTNRSNFQSTSNNYTSAVYVLMKLPEMQSIGLEGGHSRDHQPGEIVQTKVYERNADVSATSGLTGELGSLDFTPLYGNSLLEFNIHANTGTNSAGSVFWSIYQGSSSVVGTLIRRTGNQIVAGYDQAADGHPLPFSWTQYYQLNDDKKSTYRYRVRFTPSGATYWGHTYGSTSHSYFTIKEIKQEHNATGITD